MARQNGMAGGTLKSNLVGMLLLVVAVGFFAFIAVRWIAPSLAALAPVLGLFAVVSLLTTGNVYLHAYTDLAAACARIGTYITCYNGSRRHTGLGRRTPDHAHAG